ncbi:MAG: hypothetical protein ACF8XB_03305 [Planctomycetota bacterium JB042]
MKMMNSLLAPLALVAAACAPEEETAAPAVETDAGSEFLRYVEEEEGGGARLQTSIVRYKDADGRLVDLIGVVHIGEQSYYEDLNALFTTYDALLYELVAPESYRPTKDRSVGGLGLFQKGFGDLLRLTFQLDHVDYQAENFVHADVTPTRLSELMDERGENLFSLVISAMLTSMKAQASIDPEEAQAQGVEMLLALLSTDGGRSLKKVLARQFGDLERIAAGLGDSKMGELLLTERNKACIEVVEEQLDEGDRRLGVFYGAAHMPDLEQRLLRMGFERASEAWMDAWVVPPRPREKAAEEF